jgi:N-formylglutamate amidohydrolase
MPAVPDKPIVVVRGTLPAILACGHDGSWAPPGVPLRQPYPNPKRLLPTFSTQRDIKTGYLTLAIAQKLTEVLGTNPLIVFANVARAFVDVNRERRFAYEGYAGAEAWDGYHDLLDAVVQEFRQGLLLDIHGTSIAKADLYLGTCHGTTANPVIVATFVAGLTKLGYRVLVDHPRLSGGYTVQAHGMQAGGLNAIQVEVAKMLRTDDHRRERLAQDLANVVATVLAGHGFPIAAKALN